MMNLSGKRVTVAGLGRFGGNISAARWLVEQGAKVTVTDRDTEDKLVDSLKQLEGLPITHHLGGHIASDFTGADLIVASPAIPLSNEFLAMSRAANVPITTEIRLFVERCPATILGVTGTKGKSTTTRLLGDMLTHGFKDQRNIWVGGNIGGSLLFDLPRIEPHDLVVLELSSFMLEHLRAMQWSPHVALMTMVTRDHIEWHGSDDAYVAAKKVILQFQRRDDYAIINEHDPASITLAEATPARVEYFGTKGRKPFALKIPGAHNQLNAQAAFTAAACVGVTWDQAQTAIKDFTGLPHRLQLVHEHVGVRYINDSIATIPEAAVAALESFPPKTVLQIVGGYDKHLDMSPLCAALATRAKVVLCIGDTGPAIAAALMSMKHAGSPPVHDCRDLAAAIQSARQFATAGDTILLSTGCASYDQFPNFQKRGELFTELSRNP